jgi:glycosyltransferase involved in cell wall biosynthesis
MSPAISAIVCTFNRRDVLVDALEALTRQDLPQRDYEVIVVDNNSTDGTQEVIRDRFSRVLNLRVVEERKQGLASARNAGVRACRSPIAAFTDDDSLVPADWLRRLLRLFETLDPPPGVVGGEVEPIFEAERPSWLCDELLQPLSAGLHWSKEARYLDVKQREWLCEVNAAYRVEPLLAAGGFPENLGRVGDNLMSNEGFVGMVLQHAGHGLYYDPRIVVRHRIPATRLNRSWFRRRMFWQGVSEAAVWEYLKDHGIHDRVLRPLHVPCTPDDWVHMFDDGIDDADFSRALFSILSMGYLLGTQHLMRGR